MFTVDYCKTLAVVIAEGGILSALESLRGGAACAIKIILKTT